MRDTGPSPSLSSRLYDPTHVIAVVDAMMCDKNLAFPPSFPAADLTSERMVYGDGRMVNSHDPDLSPKKMILSITLRHNAGADAAFWRDLRARTPPDETNVILRDTTPINMCHYECINDDIVELLNEIGADVDAVDFGGVTLCMVAVMYRHTQMVSNLLDDGADPNATNHAGVSPAWIAAFNGDLDLLQVLDSAGADLRAPRSDTREMPRDIAMRKGHESIVCWFDDNFEPQAKETEFLNAAAEGNYAAMCELHQEHGVDIHARDDRGRGAVFYCAFGGHHLMVADLHKMGLDLDASDREGFTPAWIAVKQGHETVLKTLVDCGVDLKVAAAIICSCGQPRKDDTAFWSCSPSVARTFTRGTRMVAMQRILQLQEATLMSSPHFTRWGSISMSKITRGVRRRAWRSSMVTRQF